jgi:hypothetical protein
MFCIFFNRNFVQLFIYSVEKECYLSINIRRFIIWILNIWISLKKNVPMVRKLKVKFELLVNLYFLMNLKILYILTRTTRGT